MNHSFFAYIFRMRYIARWALMRNTRVENVEEHSYEVAVLAHALAVVGRDVFHKELDPDRAASAALFHDAPEIITGDMPTPIKYNKCRVWPRRRRNHVRPACPGHGGGGLVHGPHGPDLPPHPGRFGIGPWDWR